MPYQLYGGREKSDKWTTITVKQAKALAKRAGWDGYLNGLTALPEKTARALARHKGLLSLDGLVSLDRRTAEALAKHRHNLSLEGLRHLDGQMKMTLAKHKGDLSVSPLAWLSEELDEVFG